MPRKRHDEGNEPAKHVGQQRMPTPDTDQLDHDAPMYQRCTAAYGHEAGEAASRRCSVHWRQQHSRTRTICICVDDFGLHAGVNEAALQLAEMGRVHAIGCLVGGEAWCSKWISRLQRLDAQAVDIGLHLDLTEVPLLPNSQRPLASLLVDSLLRRLDTSAVRAEIRAQLKEFEAAFGRRPAFVDGHQHVHQFAGVREELLGELATHRTGRPPVWLRSTRAASRAQACGWRAWAKACGIQMLGGNALARMSRRLGLPQNKHLLGVYDFTGGPDRYRTRLEHWIALSEHADLLMCHPAIGFVSDDPLIAARRAEFQVLSDSSLDLLLEQAGVKLACMSRILAALQPQA